MINFAVEQCEYHNGNCRVKVTLALIAKPEALPQDVYDIIVNHVAADQYIVEKNTLLQSVETAIKGARANRDNAIRGAVGLHASLAGLDGAIIDNLAVEKPNNLPEDIYNEITDYRGNQYFAAKNSVIAVAETAIMGPIDDRDQEIRDEVARHVNLLGLDNLIIAKLIVKRPDTMPEEIYDDIVDHDGGAMHHVQEKNLAIAEVHRAITDNNSLRDTEINNAINSRASLAGANIGATIIGRLPQARPAAVPKNVYDLIVNQDGLLENLVEKNRAIVAVNGALTGAPAARNAQISRAINVEPALRQDADLVANIIAELPVIVGDALVIKPDDMPLDVYQKIIDHGGIGNFVADKNLVIVAVTNAITGNIALRDQAIRQAIVGHADLAGLDATVINVLIIEKPALLPQNIYDAIVDHDGTEQHITDKNQVIAAVDVILQGAIQNRDQNIRNTVALYPALATLDDTIIAMLIVVKPATMPQNVYDAIVQSNGAGNHISEKNRVMGVINAILVANNATRDRDITNAINAEAPLRNANLHATIIGYLPVILALKPDTMDDQVYNTIANYGGQGNLLVDKNQAINRIDAIIVANAITRDVDIRVAINAFPNLQPGTLAQDIINIIGPQVFDARGFLPDGRNLNGTRFGANGFDLFGYNAQGYNQHGYDVNGFNAQGINAGLVHYSGHNANQVGDLTYQQHDGSWLVVTNAGGIDVNETFSAYGMNQAGQFRAWPHGPNDFHEKFNKDGFNVEDKNFLRILKNDFNVRGYDAILDLPEVQNNAGNLYPDDLSALLQNFKTQCFEPRFYDINEAEIKVLDSEQMFNDVFIDAFSYEAQLEHDSSDRPIAMTMLERNQANTAYVQRNADDIRRDYKNYLKKGIYFCNKFLFAGDLNRDAALDFSRHSVKNGPILKDELPVGDYKTYLEARNNAVPLDFMAKIRLVLNTPAVLNLAEYSEGNDRRNYGTVMPLGQDNTKGVRWQHVEANLRVYDPLGNGKDFDLSRLYLRLIAEKIDSASLDQKALFAGELAHGGVHCPDAKRKSIESFVTQIASDEKDAMLAKADSILGLGNLEVSIKKALHKTKLNYVYDWIIQTLQVRNVQEQLSPLSSIWNSLRQDFGLPEKENQFNFNYPIRKDRFFGKQVDITQANYPGELNAQSRPVDVHNFTPYGGYTKELIYVRLAGVNDNNSQLVLIKNEIFGPLWHLITQPHDAANRFIQVNWVDKALNHPILKLLMVRTGVTEVQ